MAGAPLLLLLLPLLCAWPAASQEAPRTPDWRLTLKTIRNGVHKIDVYLNAALELLGGEDGLCHYKCSDGEGGAGGGNGRPWALTGSAAPRPCPRLPRWCEAAKGGEGSPPGSGLGPDCDPDWVGTPGLRPAAGTGLQRAVGVPTPGR